ncbi:MAG TPA: EipA family protein [Hyphomicrobiaceae bacterium]|nr:EipA family protein [Hyphomicrobiaceae bacterium]
MPSRPSNHVLAGALWCFLPLVAASAALAQDQLPWRQAAGADDSYNPNEAYAGNGAYGPNDAYRPDGAYPRNDGSGASDTYRPPGAYGANDGYGSGGYRGNDAYRAQGSDSYRRDSFGDPGAPPRDGGPYGYGEPYAPPGAQPYEPGYGEAPPGRPGYFEQSEVVRAGHGFFGSISKGLASAIEYTFQSQGRPNGYILGEDAAGAIVVGLRYGEGMLYTKDAGDYKVYWQGPTVGYDAGADGSKTMVLVYNLRDPSQIYHRFAGVEGSAYLVGGVSVQFQKDGDVTLALIRSGVGLRLGANVGYLKYTRSPTWNPL